MNRKTLIVIIALAVILLPLIAQAIVTQKKPISASQSKKCPAILGTCRANINDADSASWGSGGWDYVATNVRFYVSGSPAIRYSFSGYVKACTSGSCKIRTISKDGSATSGAVWDLGVGVNGAPPVTGSAYMKGWCEAYLPPGMSTDLLIAGIGFSGNVGVTDYDSGSGGCGSASLEVDANAPAQGYVKVNGDAVYNLPKTYTSPGIYQLEAESFTSQEPAPSNPRPEGNSLICRPYCRWSFSYLSDHGVSGGYRVFSRSWSRRTAYDFYYKYNLTKQGTVKITVKQYNPAGPGGGMTVYASLGGETKSCSSSTCRFTINGKGLLEIWRGKKGKDSVLRGYVTLVKVEVASSSYYKFAYWSLENQEDGNLLDISTDPSYTVNLQEGQKLKAVAHYNETPPPPPKPPGNETIYVRIDSVSVEVWPALPNTSDTYGRANRLLSGEWFIAKVSVRASSYNATGPGGTQPANLTIIVPDREWYQLSAWSGGSYSLSDQEYRVQLRVNSSGAYAFWLPLPKELTWKSVYGMYGYYNFTISYDWSNGNLTGSGSAGATVMLANENGPPGKPGEGAGEGGGAVYNSTCSELFWLPVNADEAYIVVVLFWPDGESVLYRDWLDAPLFAELRGDGWNVYLEASEWGEIKPKIEPVYRTTMIWSNLSGLPDDAAVLYSRVRISNIRISSLSSYVELSFGSWFPSKKVYVAELSAPVYSLNIASGSVTGTLKVLDWAREKPVVEGWAALSLEYINGSIAYSRAFYGDGYVRFEAGSRDLHRLWAIVYAPGFNKIYLNGKYGKILLICAEKS